MSKKVKYKCYSCGYLNNTEEYYCIKCGHWLLDTKFPSVAVHPKPWFKRTVVSLLVIGLLGAGGMWINKNHPDIIDRARGIVGGDFGVEGAYTVKEKLGELTTLSKGTREDPIKMSEKRTVPLRQHNMDGSESNLFYVSTVVNKTLRGEQANAKVAEWASSNPKPDKGYNYLIANITLYINSSGNTPLYLDERAFNFYSSEGEEYEKQLIVIKESVNGELAVGSTYSGWIVTMVKNDKNTNPLLEFMNAWFEL